MQAGNRTSGHCPDDKVVPGLWDWILDYEDLETPPEITTAGGYILLGGATGTVAGAVTCKDGKKLKVKIGCPLFPPKEAAKKRVATVVGQHHP